MEAVRSLVLIILDGWGLAPPGPGNAISLAQTPNFDRLWTVFPHTQLEASGEAVGLPPAEDGNSETGHLNIGAGHIVYQDLPRINMAVAEGAFFKIPAFLKAVDHVKTNNSILHLMGMISDAGIHSSLNHLFALLRLARNEGISRVFLHLFTDGRDSPPNSSLIYLTSIQNMIQEIGVGEIATLIGRYYAMDRDLRWERVKKAYELLVLGRGRSAVSVEAAINQSYQDGKTDEFIEPIVLTQKDGRPRGLINDNDAVIFFNFRIDRPRQLTKAFVLPDFESLQIQRASFDPYAEKYGLKQYEPPQGDTTFRREKVLKNLFFVTMTEYERGLPVEVAFRPILVQMPLGRVLSENGLRQLHAAETEKFPHVSYFFNGGRERKFPGEDQILIASPRVATYDLKPEMAAYEVTEAVLKRIRSRIYQFTILNFANPDMVGHTGDLSAAIKACEVVDDCLRKVVRNTISLGGIAVVTADHGNVEEMINLKTGQADTEHSCNPVPFIVASSTLSQGGRNLPAGILADISPTILHLMGISVPSSMSGRNLLSSL
ncbi:MAG: 2,3-bisphosphoglycerate-independent phosphoglycerate mutase [Candidatus Pacebacteria bacterium]|nr:2,3-bisphosphoglycerate-independent phosphoglycerate mutase [Candidatus Paceibacterota bacterium]